jgi:hypothetical protein
VRHAGGHRWAAAPASVNRWLRTSHKSRARLALPRAGDGPGRRLCPRNPCSRPRRHDLRPLDQGSTTSRRMLLGLDSPNAAARLVDSGPCAGTPRKCRSCATTRSESWARPRRCIE